MVSEKPTYWLAEPEDENSLVAEEGLSATARWRFFQLLFIFLSVAIYYFSRGALGEGTRTQLHQTLQVIGDTAFWPYLLPTGLVMYVPDLPETLVGDITLQWMVAHLFFAFLTLIAIFARRKEREELARSYVDSGVDAGRIALLMIFFRTLVFVFTCFAALLLNYILVLLGMHHWDDTATLLVFQIANVLAVVINWMALRLLIQEIWAYQNSQPKAPLGMEYRRVKAKAGFASSAAAKAETKDKPASPIFRK